MAAFRVIATLLLTSMVLAGPVLADQVVDLTPGVDGYSGIKPGDDNTRGTGTDDTKPAEDTSQSQHDSSEASQDTYEAPTLQTRHFGSQVALSCKVSGKTGALELVNLSDEPLPPGTRVKWQFRQDRLTGFFATIGPWGAGRRLIADGVLGNSNPSGECVARVI